MDFYFYDTQARNAAANTHIISKQYIKDIRAFCSVEDNNIITYIYYSFCNDFYNDVPQLHIYQKTKNSNNTDLFGPEIFITDECRFDTCYCDESYYNIPLYNIFVSDPNECIRRTSQKNCYITNIDSKKFYILYNPLTARFRNQINTILKFCLQKYQNDFEDTNFIFCHNMYHIPVYNLDIHIMTKHTAIMTLSDGYINFYIYDREIVYSAECYYTYNIKHSNNNKLFIDRTINGTNHKEYQIFDITETLKDMIMFYNSYYHLTQFIDCVPHDYLHGFLFNFNNNCLSISTTTHPFSSRIIDSDDIILDEKFNFKFNNRFYNDLNYFFNDFNKDIQKEFNQYMSEHINYLKFGKESNYENSKDM